MLPQLLTHIPGPHSHALALRLERVESRNVTFCDAEFPIFWERAAGVNVWDADGNRFLDLTSAFGVAGLGHSNEAIADALRAQSGRLLHAMGDVHPVELKVQLCEQLSALTFERWSAGTGKTILGNSGSDAVEAALKTSLIFSGKPGVLAFTGGYHGLGFGALTAGGLPFFREPFREQLKDFVTLLPFPSGPEADLSALRAQLYEAIAQREIGSVLVEPIQGRGGIVMPPPDFLPLLREVCDETGTLLILDEIYTGFHRTGALFACEHSGVVPDVICLGKALTGGFPLSACVGRAEIMDAWPESHGEALHTSTFLGNPLGCRMALAALEQHAKPETAELVAATAASLRAALETIRSPHLRGLRGRGLMLGMELTNGDLAVRTLKAALREGILLLADGPESNVLAFTPPFALNQEEIRFSTGVIQHLLNQA
jgi:4-aminobutyrate aminotransferase-like enzyme